MRGVGGFSEGSWLCGSGGGSKDMVEGGLVGKRKCRFGAS